MLTYKGIVTGLHKSEVMQVPNLKRFQEGIFRISEAGMLSQLSGQTHKLTGFTPEKPASQ
jgi:hypothetical protein